MHYMTHYNRLIENAKLRTSINEYTEMHHIIPRCMGGDNSNANLVRLTAKEHFVAHHLLYAAYRTTKLAHAWFMMTVTSKNQERSCTAAQYSQARLAHIGALKVSMKGEGNHFYGKTHTEETKAKIAKGNTGKKRTQEFKDAYSSRFKGVPKSEEHKAKIGRKGLVMLQNIDTLKTIRVSREEASTLDETVWLNPSKVKPEAKFKCKHCDVVTNKGNLSRWHNDNCKHKK